MNRSNAMTEGLKGEIQELKTVAKGYRTSANFRSAMLFSMVVQSHNPTNLKVKQNKIYTSKIDTFIFLWKTKKIQIWSAKAIAN